MISWPRMVKSKMAMVLTSAESLINETAWPVRGGKEYAEWPGQHNQPVGLIGVQPDTECSLPLSPVGGDNSGAEYFRDIGTFEKTERQHRGGKRVDIENR